MNAVEMAIAEALPDVFEGAPATGGRASQQGDTIAEGGRNAHLASFDS